MCGIFAVSGAKNDAGGRVLAGLKKLEYRGYDSWGVAGRGTGEIFLEKAVGKISGVSRDFPASSEAIGHSRWATHGQVSTKNAHPHRVGRVVLAHNGIFENYLDARAELPGVDFKSETDTEVFAALIDKFLSEGMSGAAAISAATEKVVGRFAILALIEGEDGIFAARRGSPLILGRGAEETFIASDIPAFLSETRTVNYLDDDEMVRVRGGRVEFSNLKTGKPVEKRDVEVSWAVESAEKGDFPHFMIKEIFEQKETIARAINHEDEEIARFVDILRETNGAYLVSCGTANKVAMAAEYFFAEISGRKINVVPASEMAHFEKFVHDRTAVIAVSQSGETADVLEVLERGKAAGARILSLTNVESSSIARISESHLSINAGVEKAVASTKAATAQMALLFLLAWADSARSADFSEKINTGRQILRATSGNINDLLNPRYEAHIREVGERILANLPHENLFIIGRGSLYPMALEAAIKIQEVSYIHAAGFAAGELKHGPIALIEPGTSCVVLGDDQETISNATELKSRGARIIGVSATRAAVFDEWLRVPDCDGAQAIASIVPVQILAYHLAVLRGLDPDMPRNLAKSVTVK